MKHLLYISNGTFEGKLIFSTKAASFKRLSMVYGIIKKDFEIIHFKDKLDFYEMTVLILYDFLLNRSIPKLPENLYVPEEQFYRKINVFGNEYNFIQGSDVDNDILLLIDLKDLVIKAIQENFPITGKFIEKKSEAFK